MLKTTVPEFNLDFNILKTALELILISTLKTIIEFNQFIVTVLIHIMNLIQVVNIHYLG